MYLACPLFWNIRKCVTALDLARVFSTMRCLTLAWDAHSVDSRDISTVPYCSEMRQVIGITRSLDRWTWHLHCCLIFRRASRP
jgi:hypothetical protein